MDDIGVATVTIAQASAVATTIAHASATVGQGGPSNLLRHIILQPSRDEGNQWKLIIGSGKLARSYRLWRSPLMS